MNPAVIQNDRHFSVRVRRKKILKKANKRVHIRFFFFTVMHLSGLIVDCQIAWLLHACRTGQLYAACHAETSCIEALDRNESSIHLQITGDRFPRLPPASSVGRRYAFEKNLGFLVSFSQCIRSFIVEKICSQVIRYGYGNESLYVYERIQSAVFY